MSNVIATIKEIYLYPVKSMRGVSVPEAHLTVNGFVGDRRYAFVQQEIAATDGFPWFTGREKPKLILHSPRFDRLPTPEDWDVPVLVETPEGEELGVGDRRLTEQLSATVRLMNVTDRAYAERADYAFGNYRYFIGEPRALYVELKAQF